jgi:hypothetical protein
MTKIGITEQGDAALDESWDSWFRENKPTILITKSPTKLIEIFRHNFYSVESKNLMVHCTITGFGGTKVEPNVLSAIKEYPGYLFWAKHLRQRCVLRVDPIVPTEKGINTAILVIQETVNKTENPSKQSIRISFMDNYAHVKYRFKQNRIPVLPYNFHASLIERKEALKKLQSITEAEITICGEPDMPSRGCVSEHECNLFGIEFTGGQANQRAACQCSAQKQELLVKRHRCEHQCLYCYWKD